MIDDVQICFTGSLFHNILFGFFRLIEYVFKIILPGLGNIFVFIKNQNKYIPVSIMCTQAVNNNDFFNFSSKNVFCYYQNEKLI